MKLILTLLFIYFFSNFYSQDSTTIQSKKIKEINISGQKPAIKMEAGKTTLETSNLTIQQGNLKDLMQQIPGLTIDNNHQVSVKGKTGMRILIDGKTSQLALSDMKAFLESLPATSVKTIEVLTNPGAQYDAEGKSGIINIKLKKDKREGFNTKLSGGVGTMFNKFSGGIFSNYKNERFNIFGNYQYNYNDQWFGYSENRISTYENKKQYYDYIASWQNANHIHNLKTGIDLFTDKNTTIGYTLDFNTNNGQGDNYLENPSQVYDENKVLTAKYLAYNKGSDKVNTISNGLSFKTSYDSSKIDWTMDVTHTYFNQEQININENLAFDPQGNQVNAQYYYFEPNLDNRVHNLMAKTDITIPNSFAKLNLGIKNESTFNRNIYLAYLKDFGKEKYTSEQYSNNFNYNDNILASYIDATKTFGFIQADAGLRLENTLISSSNPEVARQYLNLFPNLGLAFPTDSFTYVSARFSRRIDRPSFNQLNNRVVFYNRYTGNVGVPTLQPEISNIFSLQIDRSMMNGALILSLGGEYNIEVNDISEFNFIDSNQVGYFTSGNIGKANLLSTNFNIYFKPSKTWDINLTPQYIYNDYSTEYKGVKSESKGGFFQLSGAINYTLPAKIKLSMNGFMATSMVWAQGTSEFLGSINGSMSKSFLNDKLNLVLSCSDILNSNTWIGRQTTGNISSRGTWKPETRIAWLNAIYSLGKKISYKRKDIEKSERIKSTGR